MHGHLNFILKKWGSWNMFKQVGDSITAVFPTLHSWVEHLPSAYSQLTYCCLSQLLQMHLKRIFVASIYFIQNKHVTIKTERPSCTNLQSPHAPPV